MISISLEFTKKGEMIPNVRIIRKNSHNSQMKGETFGQVESRKQDDVFD